MQKETFFYSFLLGVISASLSSAPILTWNEAVKRALAESPHLNISSDEIGEKVGLRDQSRLYPNPVAAYSVENVFGNKNWQGWKSAESRYEVGQLIELGGKRGYRFNLANYQLYMAQADYQVKILFVLSKLSRAFLQISGLQEQLKLIEEQTKIAEEVFNIVKTKVEAGKASLIQQNKAEITLSTSKITFEKIQIDLKQAKQHLAILWGASCPDFEWVDYGFYELELPPSLEECVEAFANHPELTKSEFEYLSAEQNLNLEKAVAIPDVTVTLGYKTLQDTKNKGMILGLAMPIPLFNRNQGNIQKARFEVQKIQNQQRELQLVLENKLAAAHRELLRSYREAEQLRSSVLKTALQSFKFAQEGYQEGKFEYLEMLDSQRTLFEVRERYIQALMNYHRGKAEIEYLNTHSQDE